MEKQVSIVVAASGEVKDIALSPGATVKEVLNETGLQGYQLSRKGGEPLSPDTDLFEDATDNEKLYATPRDVSVGDGGSASLLRFFALLNNAKDFIIARIRFCVNHLRKYYYSGKRVRIVRIRFIHDEIKKIKRPALCRGVKMLSGKGKECAYWQENGWRRYGNDYKGYYKTKYGKWRGLIEESFMGHYSFYLFNPPESLRGNKHWECFTHKGNGMYSVHFSRKPPDVSSGILTVEQLLNEAFEQNRKGTGNVS